MTATARETAGVTIRTTSGSVLPFAFDSAALDTDSFETVCGGKPPRPLADDVSGAISRFVVDGDPGWPRYDGDARHVMAFDVPSAVRTDGVHDRVVREVFGALR